MKKISLLIALVAVFFYGNAFAQTVLIEDSFEAYTVGNKIAAEAGVAGNDWWTTWSNAPGSNEDGVVADAQASNGSKSGHLTFGVDQVLLLGGQESGTFDLEFDIYVPQGKNGYFNILHEFNGGGSTWAMQCYLHLTNEGNNTTSAPGHGSLHAGGANVADIPCVYDAWMHFRLHVDTDADLAQYYYTMPGGQETKAHEWVWSLDSFGQNTVGRKLDAMDFYPPKDAATSEYYLDNFKFTRIGGETHASLTFDQTDIYQELNPNEMSSVEINISNAQGTSIGDWSGWVDFGEGEGGSQTSPVNYDAEPGQNTGLVGINVEAPTLVEVGAMYPASSYGGAVMGTKITKAKYFLGTSSQGGTNGLEPNTPLTFRVYGQGLNGQPGAKLAEKVLPANQIVEEWNEVTFDQPVPLTGYNVWVTVEYTQAVGGYAMNFDGASAPVPFGDMYRTNGGGAFVACSEVFSEVYGNFHIRATCQGSPISGSWAALSKPEGTMPAGGSDKVSVNFSSINQPNGTNLHANVKFVTNDPEHQTVMIPITLHVGLDAVNEVNALCTVYPNPSEGSITLKGENLSSVAIYNMAGQLVRVVQLDNVVNNFDLNVEAGVYFLNVYDNAGNNSVSRLVVK